MSEINEELVERMRAAWDAYKFHIVAGVLMIVSAAAGLSYQSVVSDRARRAAGDALFAAMQAAAENDSAAAERALARIDAEEFPQLHSLALAALAAGGAEDAADKLRRAAEQEPDDGLRLLFILRRAEAMINGGEIEAAIDLLDANEETGAPEMRMLFAEKIGDAHYAAGRPRAARDSYLRAREYAFSAAPSHLPALNLKIGGAVSLPPGANAETSGN